MQAGPPLGNAAGGDLLALDVPVAVAMIGATILVAGLGGLVGGLSSEEFIHP